VKSAEGSEQWPALRLAPGPHLGRKEACEMLVESARSAKALLGGARAAITLIENQQQASLAESLHSQQVSTGKKRIGGTPITPPFDAAAKMLVDVVAREFPDLAIGLADKIKEEGDPFAAARKSIGAKLKARIKNLPRIENLPGGSRLDPELLAIDALESFGVSREEAKDWLKSVPA